MACVVLLPSIEADIARGSVTLVLEDIQCDASAAVGDRVRIDTTTPNKVKVAVDNLSKDPVIGVIKSKITATRCNVYLRGIISVTQPQGKLYLSESGDFTTVAPTPPSDSQERYLQILGYSFGNGKINLEPNQSVTKITA